jgi:hypothetical protein
VLAAKQLGRPLQKLTSAQLLDLLKIKKDLGIPDPRHGLKESDLGEKD